MSKTYRELIEEVGDWSNTEEGDEFISMVYKQTQIAYRHAKSIMEMLEEGIEPEAWNYRKIILAADYLRSVTDSMETKMISDQDAGSSDQEWPGYEKFSFRFPS